MADKSKECISAWMKITLKFDDGTSCGATVDRSTYAKIVDENDQETIQILADNCKELLGNQMINVVAVVAGEDGCEDVLERAQQPMEDNSMNDKPAGETSEGSVWKQETVLLLIALYAEHRNLFSTSAYRQKDVWIKIAGKMREKGYHVTASQCNEKFRSLKHRHKVICDSNRKSGRERRSWQYFEAMEELLEGDPAVRPVKVISSAEPQTGTVIPLLAPSGSSGNSRVSTPSPTTSSQSGSSSRSEDENTTPVVKRRKSVDAPDWFVTFVAQNERRLSALEESNRKVIAVAEERNRILSRIADALIDKQQ